MWTQMFGGGQSWWYFLDGDSNVVVSVHERYLSLWVNVSNVRESAA